MGGAAESVATDRFSLPLPGGWDDRTAVTLTGPTGVDGVQANLVVTREHLCAHMGLGAFADGWINRLADQVPVHAVSDPEHVRVDGRRAQLRVVEWRASGVEITQLVALVTDAGDAYAIVGTASSASFASHEPTFRAAVEGFRFAQPQPAADEA